MGIVSVKDLEKGMIISSDIFSKKGSLLLYKGFKIENPDLVSVVLKRNDIQTIEVKDEGSDENSKVIESDLVTQKIYSEVVEFKDEFNEIISNISNDVELFSETRDISDLKELEKSSEIAKKNEASILTIFQLLEQVKNDGTNKYSDMLQISLLSYSIGKWMLLNEKELKELSESAILHNLFVENSINSENIAQLKGVENLSTDVLNAALYARERNDGSGPMGLKGDDIPIYSRIIAIAEVFYRLTVPNDLGEKLSVFDALKIMQSEYLPVLDTKLLYIFLHRVANKYIGSTVKLSNGESGVIVFVPDIEIAYPYIKTVDGRVINLQSSEYKNNKIIEII